ncbi:type II toxin-antitoxin system HicA family toxin [Anabaena sp. UHCC 0399]|uniref:type II toxin-antitoxin system HicA family toxin n=1 Tax=Anabaena sp. UHCC 0399 TaxID=3110238 RepID=UPI002B20732F|nr:type II toxin-antitoxin system HicA family toxin [Anabaena sp. UHCC 0399]MEA5564743.1 type II toxin-antitoxin system HicA family toxin [Anabaena sp. UHCC 0399]
MELNSKHQKTLDDIFGNPVRSNIPWSDIESMLIALGAEVSEGRGSRVRIALNGVKATFHRPHPEKETNKGAVKSMRRFLTESRVKEDMDTGELSDNEI